MSADTKRSEFAETDTYTDILAETDTKTDNFLSLVNIEATFSAQLDTTGQIDLIKCPKRLEKMLMDKNKEVKMIKHITSFRLMTIVLIGGDKKVENN